MGVQQAAGPLKGAAKNWMGEQLLAPAHGLGVPPVGLGAHQPGQLSRPAGRQSHLQPVLTRWTLDHQGP